MLYSIENDKLSIQVNDYGAELWSVYDKQTKTEHLWQGEASIWPRRAPILFPICGEFSKGFCTVNGKEYKMPLHGIARDYVHELVEKTQTSLRLRFSADEKTLKQYPYLFQFDSVFTLNGDTLEHAFEVSNTGNEILPFSTGYHTGYRTAQKANESIDDYELHFESIEPELLQLDEERTAKNLEKLLSNNCKVLKLNSGVFVDTVTIKNKKSASVTLKNAKTGSGLKITAPEAPALLLWSSTEKAPYLCIEPWWGEKETNSNYGDLSNKPGMTLLESGKTLRFAQEITVL